MARARAICASAALAALAFCAPARADIPASPVAIPTQGRTIESFVPKGYRILERHDADLDGDGLQDVVLVVEVDDEVLAYENPRPLLILFRQRAGGYRLSARFDDAIYTASPGANGDAFYGIDIVGRTVVVKDGEISLGGSGNDEKQKFRFQNGGWYQIGFDDHEWRYPPDGDAAKDAAAKRSGWCPELNLSADEVCLEVFHSWNLNTHEEIFRWEIYPVAVPFDKGNDPLRIQVVRRKFAPTPRAPPAGPSPKE